MTTSVKAMASLALAVLSTCIWAFTDLSPLSVAPIAFACVILAAGASTRLGQPKQLVKLVGETLLERTVRIALQ